MKITTLMTIGASLLLTSFASTSDAFTLCVGNYTRPAGMEFFANYIVRCGSTGQNIKTYHQSKAFGLFASAAKKAAVKSELVAKLAGEGLLHVSKGEELDVFSDVSSLSKASFCATKREPWGRVLHCSENAVVTKNALKNQGHDATLEENGFRKAMTMNNHDKIKLYIKHN